MNSAIDHKPRWLGFALQGGGSMLFLASALVGAVFGLLSGAFILEQLYRGLTVSVGIVVVCGLGVWAAIRLVRFGGQIRGSKSDRILLAGLGVTSAILLLIFWLVAGSEVRAAIHFSNITAKAGQYFDSLTPDDIQKWIARSQPLLAQYNAGKIPDGYIRHDDLPRDLQNLNVSGILVSDDTVYYEWVGGFDHPGLEVRKKSDGMFQVTAIYSDEDSRVIWPKP